MRPFLRFLVVASLAAGLVARAAEAESAEPAARAIAAPGGARPAAPAPKTELSWFDATILGLVEGVTEFLPVSSTGHLIVAEHFLGLNDDRPLTDARGAPRWIKPPSADRPAGVPLTAHTAAKAYAVIIQIGAIGAVVMLYWGQLWSLVLGLFGLDREGARLLRNIVIAVLPTVVVGLLLEAWIDANLFSVPAVMGALAAGGLLMLWVDHARRRGSWSHAETRKPSELSAREALVVGGMQCLAMWPGTSRSMMTIVGGYLVGLSPARAAEFSFLVGLPTLAGAALLKGVKTGPAMLSLYGWEPVVIGIGVSFVTAAIAVKTLVAVLTRVGLTPFAVYRFVVAGVLLFVWLG